MDAQKIVDELKILYPQKKIYFDKEENPTEILCELEGKDLNPERSVYVAVIDKKVTHNHRFGTEETFEVIKGNLVLQVAGKEYALTAGKTYTSKSGEIHTVIGHGTWIKVTSKPAWEPKEHVLAKNDR